MNLQQLRYVVALAETQSFTKAADNVFVVQSALSQQIRKLEDELGVHVVRTHDAVGVLDGGRRGPAAGGSSGAGRGRPGSSRAQGDSAEPSADG